MSISISIELELPTVVSDCCMRHLKEEFELGIEETIFNGLRSRDILEVPGEPGEPSIEADWQICIDDS